MDNDKTIGRGNTSGSSPVRSTPTAAVSSNTNDTPQNNPFPLPSTTPPPTTTATITNNNNTVWPTVYNQYELSNRIGQGAFASVWRARIKNTSISNENDDGACDEQQQQQVECAIKIMDLEHVNINISGELFFDLCSGCMWWCDSYGDFLVIENFYEVCCWLG